MWQWETRPHVWRGLRAAAFRGRGLPLAIGSLQPSFGLLARWLGNGGRDLPRDLASELPRIFAETLGAWASAQPRARVEGHFSAQTVAGTKVLWEIRPGRHIPGTIERDNNDGTYTCTYEVTASPEALTELAAVAGSELGAQPAVSGVLQIFCTMAGLPIQGSPFSPVLKLATTEQVPLGLDWAAIPQHSDAATNGETEYESAIAAAAAYPSPFDAGNTSNLPPPAPPTAPAQAPCARIACADSLIWLIRSVRVCEAREKRERLVAKR